VVGRGVNSARFSLSVTRALADQMASALSELTPGRLTSEALNGLDEYPGVYQLYHRGELVYVGKADQSLPQRLEKHLAKLSGRLNIEIRDVTFTCLYVDEDLDALAPEKMLIDRFRSQGRVRWNFNGFGNNDPGQQRDTTLYKDDHFDMLYPADLAVVITGVDAGIHVVSALVAAMKARLPYVFRIGKHPDPATKTVLVATHDPTADELFGLIAEALPGWQLTALPGYVIMYPERREYPSARRVYRAGEPRGSGERTSGGR
jgi:hypothetical protein